MKPTARKFTQSRPCSKVEIWNCFGGRRGFRVRQVYEAEGELGRHVPRHMIGAGRLSMEETDDGMLVFELTDTGKAWLRAGIVRYLNNHPERIDEVWNKLPNSLRLKIRRPT